MYYLVHCTLACSHCEWEVLLPVGDGDDSAFVGQIDSTNYSQQADGRTELHCPYISLSVYFVIFRGHCVMRAMGYVASKTKLLNGKNRNILIFLRAYEPFLYD